MKHIQSSVKVYMTKDYDRFKKLDGNRAVNPNKIKRIKQAIEDGVNVLMYNPCMVDEDMRILDGQHRFEVAKEMEEDVHYVIVPNMGIKEVAKINSNSSNWTINDYLDSYIKVGLKAYLHLREVQQKYPMNTMILANLLHGGGSGHNVKEIFIDGQLAINYPNETEKMLELLKDFTDYTDKPYSRRMLRAMEILQDKGVYDHEHMMHKLKQSGYRIDRTDSAKSVIAQMEEIANYRMKDTIRIT